MNDKPQLTDELKQEILEWLFGNEGVAYKAIEDGILQDRIILPADKVKMSA